MSAAAEMDIWPLPIKSANFDTVFDSVKSSSRLRFLTARENIWTFRDARTRRNLKSTSKLFRPSVSKMLAALCYQPIAGLALQTHCCRSLSLSVLWEGYILSICRGINMLWSGHERHRNSEIRMTNPYAVEWSWKTSKFWNKDDEPLSHVFHWIAPFFLSSVHDVSKSCRLDSSLEPRHDHSMQSAYGPEARQSPGSKRMQMFITCNTPFSPHTCFFTQSSLTRKARKLAKPVRWNLTWCVVSIIFHLLLDATAACTWQWNCVTCKPSESKYCCTQQLLHRAKLLQVVP